MKYLLVLICLLLTSAVAQAAEGKNGPPPARVVVAPVEERVVAKNTPIIGTLYFDRVSRISTEVSGLVKSISLRAGDRVKKGQILARLNTDFIEKEIDLALTRIELVDVQIARKDKDIKRYGTLYKENAAAEKAYDDLVFGHSELFKEKDALLKQLEIARLKKSKSVIRAPFDGIALEKYVEIGDWVAPGTNLCRLGSLDDLCVKVPVSEELMLFSAKGEQIEVTLTAFAKKVTGVIRGFLPVADLKTKNVMIKIGLPRIPMVVENMSAIVLVPTDSPKKMTLVPRDALVNFRGTEMVFTVKEGRAVPLPLKVSAFVGEFAGVEDPMFVKGMPVIVDGGSRLMPDQPVQIIEKDATVLDKDKK